VTAARGRGKSAAIGIATAAAVMMGSSSIFISAPSPENLPTYFEFLVKGLEALGLKENQHFDVVQSTNPEFNKAVVRVNIYKTHR
jgi:N-acetyltransferase 10